MKSNFQLISTEILSSIPFGFVCETFFSEFHQLQQEVKVLREERLTKKDQETLRGLIHQHGLRLEDLNKELNSSLASWDHNEKELARVKYFDEFGPEFKKSFLAFINHRNRPCSTCKKWELPQSITLRDYCCNGGFRPEYCDGAALYRDMSEKIHQEFGHSRHNWLPTLQLTNLKNLDRLFKLFKEMTGSSHLREHEFLGRIESSKEMHKWQS